MRKRGQIRKEREEKGKMCEKGIKIRAKWMHER
jgi:hypothetical protein